MRTIVSSEGTLLMELNLHLHVESCDLSVLVPDLIINMATWTKGRQINILEGLSHCSGHELIPKLRIQSEIEKSVL